VTSAAERGSPGNATTLVTAQGRPVAVRVRHVRLDVVRGPDAGASASLTGRALSIGTHRSNDLVLRDPAVSRFHVRIHAEARGYRVRDEASTNGTRVDGVVVADAFLGDGARLEVGGTTIAVRFEPEASEVELSSDHAFGGALGASVVMRELFAAARRVAATDAAVLILGETGTGKGLLARAIHAHSRRACGPYVVLDCAALPADLVETTLFGHARGAFSGADRERAGVFEQASGGTLLLDEIGELPRALQPKLLRALESGSVTPIGATAAVAVDVRILAATSRDLRGMVEAGAFRDDLYYRLAVVPLELPPLRQRAEDIPLLAGHFARALLAAEGREPRWLAMHLEQAFGALAAYAWPGNVRELRNVIERAVVVSDPGALDADALSQLITLRDSIARTMVAPPPLEAARAQFDREYLRDVLARAHGDLTRAAALAGIHPKSLERLLRRYGLPRQ
jgi:transcriptional regulator with GAF, ATPase, and Fis domain